jgi:hypothetical protein
LEKPEPKFYMSKKVLKLAGKRPMLLAIIVMATFTLGLLFSGWLTPTPGRAQPDPTPNVETTNCVALPNTTNCVSEASVTLSNVPPAIVCLGSGVGAGTGVITNLGEAIVTTTYTNEGNSGSAACPPDYITNTTPALITNWWTASGCGIGTNGSGLSTGSTPLIPTNSGQVTITFYQKWQGVCDANIKTASVVGTVYVVQIIHECVATTPTNRNRTIIGVGESVNLTASGAPGIVTWTASPGSVLLTGDNTATFTALDRAATAIVTANYDGGSCTLSFDVKEPTGVNLLTNVLQHTSGRPDIGFYAFIGLMPDTVNFGAVQCQEEDCNFIADGVYAFMDGKSHEGTDGPTTLFFGSTVYPGLGTIGYFRDHVYSGDSANNIPPFTSGTENILIPWDFRVRSTGVWKTDFTSLIHNCSLSGGVNLMASKASAYWSCLVSDPTRP